MKINKKFKVIIAAIIALAVIAGGSYILIHYVQSDDLSDIEKSAEQYIKEYNEDETVLEFGNWASSSFKEVYAIVVKTELDGEKFVKCVWFEKDRIFSNRYVPAEISETKPGKVKAYRQRTGSKYFDYIFGMDIPESKRHFTIPYARYEGYASEGEILEIKDVSYVGPLEIEYSK